MRRTLFAREFRSALVPNLVTVGAILATLVLLERLYGLRLGKAEDVRYFTDFALLAGLVVSGFISGERCFPAELKESRILFLSSLPISRSWVWLVIVSARLLAALASLALAVALRRPLVLLDSWDLLRLGIVLVALAFGAYVLFFSAGTLFALLFRRTLCSYVAGFLILGILLGETLVSSFYSTVPPHPLRLAQIPGPSDSLYPIQIVAFLSLLLVLSLLLSWRFFIRGEIGNPKRRIRNQILFGITATVYLGFVFYGMSSARLTSVGSTWSAISPARFYRDHGMPYSVSPDGRYLAVFESLDHRPFMVRVSIVDTRTGRVTGQLVSEGVGWGYWSGHGDLLNLLVLNNSPLDRWGYLVPGSVDWIRLSHEAREISKLRLKGVEEVKTLTGGRALVVLRESGQGRIIILNGASGRPSEMVRAPLDGQMRVQGDGPAALVYFDNVLLPRRAWVVDSLAREVRAPRSAPQTPYVLFGEASGTPAEAQAALRRRYPPPSTPGDMPIRGSFLLPAEDQMWLLTAGPDVKGLYFRDESAPDGQGLWARPTAPEGRWERLPGLAPNLSRSVGGFSQLPSFVDFASGVGAFLSEEGGGSFFVYDPRIGVIRETGRCAREGRAFLNVERVPGLRALLIELTCMDASSSSRGQVYYFDYLSGSREVRAIKTVPIPPFYAPQPLYLDERGWEVSRTQDQEGSEEIWRSSPGTNDLRLWAQGMAKASGEAGGRSALRGFSF
jgi:hypothetical protein